MSASPLDPEAFEVERVARAFGARKELLAYLARHPSLATPAEIRSAGLPPGLLTTSEIRALATEALREMAPSALDPCGTISMFEDPPGAVAGP